MPLDLENEFLNDVFKDDINTRTFLPKVIDTLQNFDQCLKFMKIVVIMSFLKYEV